MRVETWGWRGYDGAAKLGSVLADVLHDACRRSPKHHRSFLTARTGPDVDFSLSRLTCGPPSTTHGLVPLASEQQRPPASVQPIVNMGGWVPPTAMLTPPENLLKHTLLVHVHGRARQIFKHLPPNPACPRVTVNDGGDQGTIRVLGRDWIRGEQQGWIVSGSTGGTGTEASV